MSNLTMLAADVVEAVLTPALARESQRRAFAALASGEAILPPRLLVDGVDGSTAFCYAARLSAGSPAVSKFGSANPANPARGLPVIQAVVTVLDAQTGTPRLVLDGIALTTLRTAAASALAVELLARADARTLAVVGTGVQGHAHLRALLDLRAWDEVLVVDTNRDKADALVAAFPDAPCRVATASEASARAEVIALCTTSRTPVLDEAALRPGTTIVGVGSFEPGRCEVSPELLARSRAVVDDVDTCATDAGPVLAGLEADLFGREHLVGLGDVVLGRQPGRRTDEEIVVHTSVGIGVQDAAAAQAVLDASPA